MWRVRHWAGMCGVCVETLPGAGAPLTRCGTFSEALPKGGHRVQTSPVLPSASLTFFSNTHSSLAPASPGASGAGPAGTFFPWEQKGREGKEGEGG